MLYFLIGVLGMAVRAALMMMDCSVWMLLMSVFVSWMCDCGVDCIDCCIFFFFFGKGPSQPFFR